MPWNTQNGNGGRGNGGGRGPWGQGPSGGTPPDLEELLRRSQDRLRQVLPHGFGIGGAAIAALIIVVVWLFSGVYVVAQDEQGVVLRFGQFVGTTTPGINYHFPWPIETVETPTVTRENQINIGYRLAGDVSRNDDAHDVPEESQMLTGDENIVDIDFTVFWVVKNAGAYLFNVEDTDAAIKAVAESAMREVVGRNQIEPILTADREPIQDQVQKLMQQTLDAYGAGVTVTRVQMQKVDPPTQVIDAYRDVQAARADLDRMRNEAEAYANNVVPVAKGEAARILQDAEGYKQRTIAEAQGEAQRFDAIDEEYKKAPDVTRKRIYLETMQNILSNLNKVIVDNKGGAGVLPYLPLPELRTGSVTAGEPTVAK